MSEISSTFTQAAPQDQISPCGRVAFGSHASLNAHGHATGSSLGYDTGMGNIPVFQTAEQVGVYKKICEYFDPESIMRMKHTALLYIGFGVPIVDYMILSRCRI